MTTRKTTRKAVPAKKPVAAKRPVATKRPAPAPAPAKAPAPRKPVAPKAAAKTSGETPEKLASKKPAAKKVPAKKVPEKKPLGKRIAKPSAGDYLSATELNQLRLMELKKALGYEIENFEKELEQQMEKVRREFARQLKELQSSLQSIKVNEQAPEQPESFEKSVLLEKMAKKLASFRRDQAPSVEDAIKLLKAIRKTKSRIDG